MWGVGRQTSTNSNSENGVLRNCCDWPSYRIARTQQTNKYKNSRIKTGLSTAKGKVCSLLFFLLADQKWAGTRLWIISRLADHLQFNSTVNAISIMTMITSYHGTAVKWPEEFVSVCIYEPGIATNCNFDILNFNSHETTDTRHKRRE